MRITVLGLALLMVTAPVAAQDYLGTHLDTVREETMRRHQQDMSRDRPKETRSKEGTATGPASLADRQAVWSKNKAEYRRKMLREGPAAADRWLDEQARASGTTTAAPVARPNQRRANPKNCKKVRYVNRATPGFGGGPMTMSRVAVCDD